MIVTGTTSTGFTYEIDERRRKDRDILKIMVQIMRPDNEITQTCAINDLPEALLGKDQADELEAHLRTLNDGFCDIELMNDEVMEIIKGNKDLKN